MATSGVEAQHVEAQQSARSGTRTRARWRPSRTEWGLAFAAAILLRVAVMSTVVYNKENDARTYQEAADNLRSHHTFGELDAPTAFRPPGYPLLVAAVQGLTQTDWLGLRIVQLLCSVLSALALAAAIGRWYPAGLRAALWALALNPFDAYYAGAMLSETLSATLVGAATVIVLTRPRGWTVATGVILGLSALTRDQLVLLPVAFALVLGFVGFMPRKRRRSRLLALVVIPLVAGALVLPWTIRNAIHFHRLIPISAGRLGYNLWLGTWELDAEWNLGPVTLYPDYAYNDQAERDLVAKIGNQMYTDWGDKAYLELAKSRIKAHPLAVVSTWFRRAPKTWFGTRTDLFNYLPELARGSTAWKALKSAHWGLNFFVVVLGWSALRLLRSARRLKLLVYQLGTPVLYTALVYLPLHSIENRYSHPALQCLVALAAINAVATLRTVRARRSAKR